jgi:uncharacterized repeat protein (TIGR01451 family)
LLSQNSNQVNWLIPSLAANENRTFLVVVRSASNLTLNTSLTLGAQVSASTDANRSNSQTTWVTTITASNAPSSVSQPDKLAVTFSASPAAAQVGDIVTLQVVLKNNTSSETLYNVQAFSVLKGLIPDLTLVWPDASRAGVLLPQETATASFAYTVLPTFSLNNLAWAKALDADPSDGTAAVANSGSLTGFQVNGPGLTTTVSTNTQTAAVGETVTFSIQVSNDAARNDSATNLVVQDTLTGGSYSLNPSGPLAPGQTASVSFNYTVQPSDVPQLLNRVTVSGQGVTYPAIPVTTSNRITVAVTDTQAQDAANLRLDTSGVPAVLLPGQAVNLPVLLANDGTQPAANVTLRLTLPTDVELVDVGAGGDSSSYDANTRRITWSWANLNAGNGVGVSPVVRSLAQPGATHLFDLTATTVSAEIQFNDNAATLCLPVVARTASHSTLTAISRNYVIADGIDSLQISLTARDPLDSLMPNVSATLSADMPGVTFSSPTVTTDANGQAVLSLQTTEIGPVTITATFDGGGTASLVVQRRPSAIQLEQDTLTVGVGGEATLNLSVTNTTASGDHFTLHVAGREALDPQTYRFMPDTLSLAAGQFDNTKLLIGVPAGQCSLAGTYPITITTTGNAVGSVGQAQATVTILPAPPALNQLRPAAGAHVGSSAVVFSWRSNTPGTSTLYWRAQGTGNYTAQAVSANAVDPTLYSVSLPLAQGDYEWYASTTTTCGTTTTDPQLFSVTPSLAFAARAYTFTIPDDYNITQDVNGTPLMIQLQNNDSVARQVTVSTDSPYADLIVGFTGTGSVNQAATVQPGSTLSLTLRAYTQETTQDQYAINLTLKGSDGTTDSVPLALTIYRPTPDIRLENFTTDPTTLVTSARVKNYGGAPVTDLNFDVVQSGSGIPANFMVQPDLHHVCLPAGGSVDIQIIPLEILDNTVAMSTLPSRTSSTLLMSSVSAAPFDPYATMLQVTGPFQGKVCVGDSCFSIDLSQVVNQCLDDYQHTTCDGSGLYYAAGASWYCTNKPNIDVLLHLPSFTGATVVSASVSANFGPGDVGSPYSHATALSLNGAPIVSGIVPDQSVLSGDVSPDALLDGWQTLNLRSVHPYGNQAHYTVASNFSLTVEVTNFIRSMCVPQGQPVEVQCKEMVGFYTRSVQAPADACIGTVPVGINLRSAPNGSAKIVGSIPPNTQVWIQGQFPTGQAQWYYGVVNGRNLTGWFIADTTPEDIQLQGNCNNIWKTDDPLGIIPTPTPTFTPSPTWDPRTPMPTATPMPTFVPRTVAPQAQSFQDQHTAIGLPVPFSLWPVVEQDDYQTDAHCLCALPSIFRRARPDRLAALRLDDSDTRAGPDAGRARLDHRLRVLVIAHAAGRLHTDVRPDHLAHQRHVTDRRAAPAEAGAGLDEIRPGHLRHLGSNHLLFVGQLGSLENHLADDIVGVAGCHHRCDVVVQRLQVAALERADVQHHVNFGRAVLDSKLRLVSLHLRRGRAEGEADNGTHRHVAALEQVGAQRHVGAVDADRGEVVLARFPAQLRDFGGAGVRLEQRVVNQPGDAQVARDVAQAGRDAARAGIDHLLHPVGALADAAAILALAAVATARLVRAVRVGGRGCRGSRRGGRSVHLRHHLSGNLIDQLVELERGQVFVHGTSIHSLTELRFIVLSAPAGCQPSKAFSLRKTTSPQVVCPGRCYSPATP